MKSIYADKYQQIGLKIAYYRKLRGLTQEQLDYMADAILSSIDEMQRGV